MSDLEAISEATIKGDVALVRELTDAALREGLTPERILNDGLVPGMDEVGRRFRIDEFYVPEVLVAAYAMHAGLDILKPLLTESNVEPAGTVVLGTVQGDLHNIGKDLVAMMLEGAGFEVVNLGEDVPPDRFVDAIRERKPQIVGMSALLTTTMLNIKSAIEALTEAGVRDHVKVMIGGAPITQRYADDIGADGYAPDAASAVELARELIRA